MRRIWLSGVGLLLLLAATVYLSFVPLGSFNLAISLFIAVAKGLIILMIFMDLAAGSQLIRIFAIAGFFWLGILLGLPAVDYITRNTSDIPGASVR